MPQTQTPPNYFWETFLETVLGPDAELGYSMYHSDPRYWPVDMECDEGMEARPQLPWRDYRVWERAVTDLSTDLSGIKFERFLEGMFQFLGFKAKGTKGSHDAGVDLLVETPAGRVAIQAKLWAGPVPCKAVLEVYAGKAIYHADHAAVIAPWGFRRRAISFARKLDVRLFGFRGFGSGEGRNDDPYDFPFCIIDTIITYPSFFVATFLNKRYGRWSDGGVSFPGGPSADRFDERPSVHFDGRELWPHNPSEIMAECWEKATGFKVKERLACWNGLGEVIGQVQ